jgi:polyhydroxybutyrate depolymerase
VDDWKSRENGMKRALRFLLRGLIVLAALAAVLGALFGYLVYTPAPQAVQLSGTLTRGSIAVGGRQRTYRIYLPKGGARGAPLVVAMHGSGENGAVMRVETGYGFDRLADRYGSAVVYPDAYEGYWNGCNIVGDYSANKLDIDDVRFLNALVDKLAGEIGIDPARVLAVGISRGASMALRLALESPARFRAVAAVSENVPTPDNFKCKPARQGTSSVMIMNGTEDPIVPFEGGEVSLFGLFLKRGTVLSARDSGRYLAKLNNIAGRPQTSQTQMADGIVVERMLWHGNSTAEVELVAVHGGGHGLPQPYRRHPRLLGPSPQEPNGPALIWDFFTRQHPG